MLQPLQLEEVKTRYANEIAELRDFLQKAGCTPGAPESLRAIVNRLQRDRSFHRDLTSYIWVAIHSGNRNISYADLLGVLTVAAAGGRYAAEAEGDDAHALLRFVIEARESLDGTSRQKNPPAADHLPPVVPAPVAPEPPVEPKAVHPQPPEPEPAPQQSAESQPVQSQPVQSRRGRSRHVRSQQVEPQQQAEPQQVELQQAEPQQSGPPRAESQPVESQRVEPQSVEPGPVESKPVYDHEPFYPHARPFPEEFSPLKDEEEGTGTRKRLIWLTVFFLAAGLIARIAFHNRTVLDETAAPATPATTAPAESPARSTPPSPSSTPPSPRIDTAPAPAPEPEVAAPAPSTTEERGDRTPRAGSQTRGAHRPSTVNSPASAYPSTPSASPPPRVTTPSGPAPKIPPPPESRSPTPAPATTPAARPTSPSEPDLTNTDRGRAVPHLLRRTPEDQAELADASPPANMPAPTNASTTASKIAASRPAPVATPQAPRGNVRAVSLGVNASNVLYSPTPAYPQAASDAHVQGDVKVETNVDRNGNVASVRVVSGPPLLRDAALDAAQRWRYRPHFIGGDQAAMSTITVFEFQLP
ncbi:TonB family protein [Terriglobus albidus]|uniref:TonB family protein n=1 Tax=Terriglobus albidus TaxID=1592106 RepID=A0A5B9EJ42_9BACT|nr:energy transducer TonB [Terriglobus albidus]QEE30421.1 TonB family protein [Terriglobus albidus]